MLAQDYRKLVQDKSRLMKRITSGLKRYSPEALELFSRVDQPITLAFLNEFRTLKDAQTMSISEWEKWLSDHRHPQPTSKARTLHKRLHQASPDRDRATIRAESRFVNRSVKQLQTVLESLDEYEQRFDQILTQPPGRDNLQESAGRLDSAGGAVAGRVRGSPGPLRFSQRRSM